MRVTNGMMIQNTIRNINSNLQQLSKVQTQASSQKKNQVPSDDPVAAARSLELQSYLSNLQQQQDNADAAYSWMKDSDDALSDIEDMMNEVRDLTVQAANGTLTDDDKEKILKEIEELKKGIIEDGNSSYSGRYLFAGYSTDSAPFEDVSTTVGDLVTYNGKYLSLGGPVSSSVSDSDLISFYEANMDKISGQPEIESASYETFTTGSSNLDFTVTLDGQSKTISLTANTTYDITTLTSTLQSQLNTAFPSGTNQVSPLIKASQDDGKLVLTVQDGSSISISSGIGSNALDVSQLGFTGGMSSSAGDSEAITYKLGSGNRVAVNVEGSDIFGEGDDSFFNTLTKLELALNGETEYKMASYSSSSGVTVTTGTLDLSSLLDNVDDGINRMLTARADLGARTDYVELTQNRLDNNYTTYSDLLSKNDDIDLAEVSMNLASAQAAYSASLSAGAKVLQNSLLDFLK